ncbi:hypothetical protein PT276_02390 [Orbaceae bacterium ESL0721]|nr:hypothetical protein [Orbaceae bacterium ESL0721]
MIKYINKKDIVEKICLPANLYIVRIDSFNPIFNNQLNDRVRNIFKIDSEGKVIWQVFSNSDTKRDGSFQGIKMDGNNLKAYRWNGGQYDIDLETGFATPEILLK